MAHYVPLEIVKFPPKPTSESLFHRHWKHYKNVFLRQDHSSITNISISPSFYAVTSSSRVRFFTYENRNKFSLTRFKNVAIGGCFREDGELFVGGDIEGNVMVYQVSTKTLLRNYVHPKPSYSVIFANPTHLATGCDDFQVRLWDLTQKKEIFRFGEHSDYVRALEKWGEIVVSGGMDHKVKLWDKNSGKIAEIDHESPISAMVSSENVLVTAGHVTYKIWDLRTFNCVSTFTPHSKNITTLGLNASKSKIMTGSIDCMVKIHDLNTGNVEHAIKYPNPVLTAKFSPEDSHLIVGMADGKLSVRQKKNYAGKTNFAEATDEIYLKKWEEFNKKLPESVVKNYKYFNRGTHSKPEENEVVLENENKKKIREYDLLLRKFRYGEVMDIALDSERPELTISIIQELVLRNGLKDAVSAREPEFVNKIVAWLCGKIHNPKYKATVIPLTAMIIDMYSAVSGINPQVLENFKHLCKETEEEYSQITQAQEILGIIDYLLSE